MAALYALSYGQVHLGVDRDVLLTLVLLGFAFTAVGMPFFGWLSDRYDRRRIFLLGAAFMVITPFAWFALLDTGRFELMLLGSRAAEGLTIPRPWTG